MGPPALTHQLARGRWGGRQRWEGGSRGGRQRRPRVEVVQEGVGGQQGGRAVCLHPACVRASVHVWVAIDFLSWKVSVDSFELLGLKISLESQRALEEGGAGDGGVRWNDADRSLWKRPAGQARGASATCVHACVGGKMVAWSGVTRHAVRP